MSGLLQAAEKSVVGLLAVGVLCAFLAGCASMGDCPLDDDGKPHCSSLGAVYRKTDSGKSSPSPLRAAPRLSSGRGLSRTSDSVLKIWVAPYEDAGGNYHTSHAVYSVLGSGRWVVPPSPRGQHGGQR